jgi:hypothetical protein
VHREVVKHTLTINNRITGKSHTFEMGASRRGHTAPPTQVHADKRRESRADGRRELRNNWRDF